MLYFLLITWATILPSIISQCPDVVPPCICATTGLEPVHIICNKGHSLDHILSAISAANNTVKIDALTINNTIVNELLPKSFNGFHIEKLQLKKSQLNLTDEGAFEGTLVDYLTDLDLSDNYLKEIPYAIAHLKHLRRLNLSKNKIDILSSSALITWKSREILSSFDLSYNLLESNDTPAIGTLPNLQDLNLAGNRLIAVPTETLKNYKTSLKNLNLASNRIGEIKSGDFRDLDVLESLSLEYNNLAVMARDAFRPLVNLRYLYLTGNRMTAWPTDLFRPLVNLHNLGMGSSAIREIPAEAFQFLPNLARLEMSNGGVERLDINAFKSTPNLNAVLLNNNRLTQIKRGTFQGLNELYTLDLSGNLLDFIEDHTFENLISLKHLDLSNNRLKSLSDGTFSGTFASGRDSKTLFLCKNYWICDEQLNWFRHWTRENLEIIIDKPNCSATCSQPDWLNNWPIRFPNPPPPDGGGRVSSTIHTMVIPMTSGHSEATIPLGEPSFQRGMLKSGVFKGEPAKDEPTVVTTFAHFLFGQLPITIRNLIQPSS